MNTKRMITIALLLALLVPLLAGCGGDPNTAAPTPWPAWILATATPAPPGWTPSPPPPPPATATPGWTPPPDWTPPPPMPTADPTRAACASAAVDAGATQEEAIAACYPLLAAIAPTGIAAPPTSETIPGCVAFVASAMTRSHLYFTGQATEAAALEPTHVALWPTCEAAQTMEAAAP